MACLQDTLFACLLTAGISVGAWAILAWAQQHSRRLRVLRELKRVFDLKCSCGTWINGGMLTTAVTVEETCLLLGIRPSSELIVALFNVVNQRWKREGVDFGTFAVFVTEIQASRRRVLCGSVYPPGSPLKRSELVAKRRKDASSSECQVFLGGSCNPTTWREDLAVPALEEAGVTYYNPQAGNWNKEMIAIEEAAKNDARLALFVIDNQTRSISSMVETAYLAASGFEIVTVINDFTPTSTIGDHVLPLDEVQDLNAAHDSLRDVLHREQVPLFNSIDMALNHIIELLRQNRSINVLAEEDFVQAAPVRALPSFDVGGMVTTLTEIFSKKDKRIHLDHLTPMVRARLVGAGLNVTDEEILTTLQHIRSFMGTEDRSDVGFFEFASLIAELHGGAAQRNRDEAVLATKAGRGEPRKHHDLFLRGLGEGEADEEVINRIWGMCEKSSVSVLTAPDSKLRWSGRDLGRLSVETSLTSWDCCSVLLFHISSTKRSIDKCIEAAHAIGVGSKKVVLCMNLEASSLTDAKGNLLEARELKDIRRGRHYLEDCCKLKGVFMCSDIILATAEALRLVKLHKET
jgi:hypothetical protein